MKIEQKKIFEDKIELIHVSPIIDSEYSVYIADLALRDKIAYRAARKNMQIHDAIVLKINDELSGFFTFEINHEAKEFCLLQSAMEPNKKSIEIYSKMIEKIIEQNTFGYKMIMTVSRKHDLEKPSVFHDLGFKTYLVKRLESASRMTEEEINQSLNQFKTVKAWREENADYIQEATTGFNGILFIDEFFRTGDKKIQNILRGILNGKLGKDELPGNVYIIYASNMEEEETGTLDVITQNQQFFIFS